MLRRLTLFLFLALLFVPDSFAQYRLLNQEQLRTIIPSTTRYVVSLSGTWERSLDGNVWEERNLPFSERESEQIIYRRSVKVDKATIEKYSWQLHCLGINDAVELYINGRYIGRYFGSYTPFAIRIPDKIIKPGVNDIKLVITSARKGEVQYRDNSLFPNRRYIGVTRELLLVGTPHVWVNELKISSAIAANYSSANVKAVAHISAGEIEKSAMLFQRDSSGNVSAMKKAVVTVEATLRQAGGAALAQASPQEVRMDRERTIPVTFNFQVGNPALWSPASPTLYELAVRVTKNGQLIDDYTYNVGIRDVRTSGNQVLVNGSPFFIKGVEYIQEDQKSRTTLTVAQLERDVIQMKTLGANLVRMRHIAPDPYFVHLCDRYGIFVMVDVPVYDVPSGIIGAEGNIVRMKNISKSMISAYGTHPSIFGWNIADGLEFGSKLSDKYAQTIARSFDQNSDRLISYVARGEDALASAQNIDLIGLRIDKLPVRKSNSYQRIGWLLQKYKKPVFTSFGTIVQPDNLGGYSDPLSVESQARFILETYRSSMQNGATGVIVWSFNDYLLNKPLLISHSGSPYVASSGLVDRNREERLSFSMLQALFNDEKEPLLHAGSFSDETPIVFIAIAIISAIVLLFLFNRSRRFREYFSRALFRPYNFYADIRDQRLLSQLQTYLLGLITSIAVGMIFATLFYYSRMSYGAEYVLSLLVPNDGARGFINWLIWQPGLSVLFFTVLMMLIIVFVAVILRIAAIFVRGRIFFSDTMTIAVWSALPMVLLLPVSVALYKILSVTGSSNWLLLVMALFFAWFIFRVLKSTAVVFDVQPGKAYLVGVAFLVCLIGGIVALYDTNYSMLSYMQYFSSVLDK